MIGRFPFGEKVREVVQEDRISKDAFILGANIRDGNKPQRVRYEVSGPPISQIEGEGSCYNDHVKATYNKCGTISISESPEVKSI